MKRSYGKSTIPDLVMICTRLEKQGIKTVLVTDECSGWDGMSQPLTDTSKSL